MVITSLVLVGPKVLWDLSYHGILLLYLGPETIMPLASIIGAVIGFLLIFWRMLLKPFKKLARFGNSKGPETPGSDPSSAEVHHET